MNIIKSFTYVVNSTDEQTGSMELTYSAPNLPDVVVGALMPRGTQTLEEVAASFVPMRVWLDILNPVVPVEVGTTGVIQISDAPTVAKPTASIGEMPSSVL